MASSALWKGKGREDSSGMDPEQLNPVITYRHLLSSSLGVRNPLRVCGLSDMDAFYASCEQKRLGLDPSIPLVVRQWDALIAVNYPARSYGISRMDKISSALQRCPHLLVVHVATFDPSVPDAKPTYTDNPNSETHKVSLDYYRTESKKIMAVFKEMLPGAEVEKASIDEAFIDFTEPVRKCILTLFPHLATLPQGGLDTPLPPPPRDGVDLTYPSSRLASQGETKGIWSGLGIIVPISGKHPEPPKLKENSTEIPDDSSQNNDVATSKVSVKDDAIDAELDKKGTHDTFPDKDHVTHADSLEGVQGSGITVDEDLLTTWHDVALSIAASLMLKMRDEVKKRLGYTTSAGIARNKFLAKLVASYKKRDSQTILRNAAIPNYLRPLPFQKIRFLGGKLGTAIAEVYEAQTVGDLLNISIEEMQRKFGDDSIWVWEILRGIDRSEVKEKPSVNKSMGASKNLQHPITHPSEGVHWLRILAGELAFRLREAREDNPGLWPKTLALHVRQSYDISRSKQAPFPFTHSASMDFICKAAEKLWIELVGTGAEYDKKKAMGKTTGMKITNVFLGFTGVAAIATGQQSIEGFFLETEPVSKRKKISEGDTNEGSKKRKAADHDDPKLKLDSASRPDLSFWCSRCGKQIRNIHGADDRDVALSVLKMEHEDFHFAQDLTREGDESTSNSFNKKKKITGKAEAKGIVKFFSPVTSKR